MVCISESKGGDSYMSLSLHNCVKYNAEIRLICHLNTSQGNGMLFMVIDLWLQYYHDMIGSEIIK